MSTWRRRFSRKSQRFNENDEILMNNATKYRRKLQAAISQINQTKKSVQRHFDSSASEVHVARLINDIGQLSDCKSLQEISGLIDSLAMRHQLSLRIFNEYAMNALQQSLQKLNDNLSNDFDKTKSVFEEAVTNYCSDSTKSRLLTKVQYEWSKHQKLATKELKQGLSSYCNIALYNLKVQKTILEKLQNFVDQLPQDNSNINNGLPNFAANSLQTRREIDTMLRIMLDTAPNDPISLPEAKRPKFLSNRSTLSNSLYSPEITEAAARSNLPSIGQGSTNVTPQYEAASNIPLSPRNDRTQHTTIDDDQLPSYTDLFVIPGNCKEQQRNVSFQNY